MLPKPTPGYSVVVTCLLFLDTEDFPQKLATLDEHIKVYNWWFLYLLNLICLDKAYSAF